MRRIPRIKFPERRPKSSTSSGYVSEAKPVAAGSRGGDSISSSSDVPAPPKNVNEGGKAALQPSRTPVSDKEIEAVMLGGCI